MHPEALTSGTARVLNALADSGLSKSFYLAGGTALALYFGHRFSVDLDWFSESFNNSSEFTISLKSLGKLQIEYESEHTFNGALDDVRISFFQYPYKLIRPAHEYRPNVSLASLEDIAAMKMEAVSRRGSRKDFIDLYFLLERYALGELFEFVREKFAGLEYNEAHLLKSLVYFEDAEKTEMPRMIRPDSWLQIMKAIKAKVATFMKQL